jgi:S1-C subfamily serine protease
LVNLHGRLIGLNVAVHREGQGIGFAIPVKQVVEALSEIVTPEVNASLYAGGLEPGDELISVNGQAPAGLIDAVNRIGASQGNNARMVVRREGRSRTLRITLKPLAESIDQRLGLSVQELTSDLARRFGFQLRDGLLIADVHPAGPAAGLDLRPGYLLVAIGGEPTPDLLSAATLLAGRKAGDTVELTIAAWQQRGAFARLNRGTVQVRIR